jgi:cytochrome b6-f complex iron-sulfur subunit
MHRKDFLKSCGFACLGSVAMMAILQACSSGSHFAQSTVSNGLISIPKSEFVRIEKEKKILRKYVICKTEKFNQPICVFRLSDTQYSAVLMLCSHNGCELQAQGDFLICPCHGSEFSNLGVVQNPPAESNLKSFKVSFNDENVFIHA